METEGNIFFTFINIIRKFGWLKFQLINFLFFIFYLFDSFQGDTVYMYGSMNENFIQDMVERTRMDKNSSFYDIGSGIGQVQIMKPNYFI